MDLRVPYDPTLTWHSSVEPSSFDSARPSSVRFIASHFSPVYPKPYERYYYPLCWPIGPIYNPLDGFNFRAVSSPVCRPRAKHSNPTTRVPQDFPKPARGAAEITRVVSFLVAISPRSVTCEDRRKFHYSPRPVTRQEMSALATELG